MNELWVRAKDEMPAQTQEEYWVHRADGQILVAYLSINNEWFEDDYDAMVTDVTHWMPLTKPDPPTT